MPEEYKEDSPPVETEKPGEKAGEYFGTIISTNKMYKEGGIITHEKQEENPINVHVPVGGVPLAKVSAGSSMTINMGNFESVKLDVRVELPCYVEEIADCYKAAKSIVESHLGKEVKQIREYRDKRGKKSSSDKEDE